MSYICTIKLINPMNITINTDASFHPELKVGGYAFYIVSDSFRIQRAGNFKNEPKNSEEAEVMCIGNALAELMKRKDIQGVNFLTINSDCKYGMKKIQTNNGLYGKVRKLTNKTKHQLRVKKVNFKHVKAHNGAKDARSWVNEWCDTEAKKFMRKRANQIKNENIFA